jgi:hypothetical protein
MENEEATPEVVAAAVKDALQNKALSAGVLEFGDVRILMSKGRRLENESPEMELPAEYPDVPTHLPDDYDSWLQ